MPSAISQQVLGLATSTSPGLAQAGGYNILPAGIVFPYAGATAPSGFVICDGQQLSKTLYPALYAAIGDDYATQINPTTGLAWAAPSAGNFRVPDYTGLFLRGVGTPNGLDAVTRGAQQADKTKKNSLTATASTSGITSLTLTGTAAGQTLGTPTPVVVSTSGGNGEAFAWFGINAASQSTTKTAMPQGGDYPLANISANLRTDISHTHGSSTLTISKSESPTPSQVAAQTITIQTGDTETRPINKGVNYIIKV
jgi:microcystin-dependent protein